MKRTRRTKPVIKPMIFYIGTDTLRDGSIYVSGLESDGVPTLHPTIQETRSYGKCPIPVYICDARTHKVIPRKNPVDTAVFSGISIKRSKRKNHGDLPW